MLEADIDHFKAYNDHYGHAAGDQCLRMVSKVMADVLKRPSDMLARYGGEEFVVLLPSTDKAGAAAVAAQMIRAVDALQCPHATSTTAPHLTVSIGFASSAQHAVHKAAQLLHAADLALYKARSAACSSCAALCKAKATGRRRACGCAACLTRSCTCQGVC